MTTPRSRLVWRLYALGMAQLVLLAGAVVFVGYLLRSVLKPEGPDLRERSAEPRPGQPPFRENPPREDSARGEHERHGPPRGPGSRPPREPPSPVAPLLTFFISGVVVVGGGAALTWRFIARPLAELSGAARALGAGNLKARAGLARDDEFGELGRTFDEMAERLEALVLAQKELLANVSHELRTPLARIRVALDMAAERDPQRAHASLQEIAVDLGELETLIDDILTATRVDLQTGASRVPGFSLRRERVAPGSVAESARDRFSARHPERTLDLNIVPNPEGDSDATFQIDVDVNLFRRVLDNLLENAHKYSPETASIRLEVEARETGTTFEVEDRGAGIAAEDMPRIFEPFFRAERSRARGTGGVGLGLTLVKRIVDAHRGRVELSSRPGEGTTARVWLPNASAAE